jgi:hypothetical protein
MEQNHSPPHPAASVIADAASFNLNDDISSLQHMPRARHNGWNRDKMARFIEFLAETGSVSHAADMVGMSRHSAYRLRSRMIGQPFDVAWEGALEFGIQQLAHQLLDRSLNGVPMPVFYKGEIVGERRVFNERVSLMIIQNMDKFGRLHLERDMTARRWPEMINRLRDGPIIWTDEEKHGDDPDHPMNMDEKDLEALAREEDEDEGDASQAEAALKARNREVENFAKRDSHYAKPPEPPFQQMKRPRGWRR